jgi:hypothetical protein
VPGCAICCANSVRAISDGGGSRTARPHKGRHGQRGHAERTRLHRSMPRASGSSRGAGAR